MRGWFRSVVRLVRRWVRVMVSARASKSRVLSAVAGVAEFGVGVGQLAGPFDGGGRCGFFPMLSPSSWWPLLCVVVVAVRARPWSTA